MPATALHRSGSGWPGRTSRRCPPPPYTHKLMPGSKSFDWPSRSETQTQTRMHADVQSYTLCLCLLSAVPHLLRHSHAFKFLPRSHICTYTAVHTESTPAPLLVSWCRQLVLTVPAGTGPDSSRRRDCHSAAPPRSPFSRCFNTDGEGMSAK